MVMDFSSGAGAATPFDLIPQGQLAWAILSVRGVKASASGGGYIDLELTLDDGQPFARKKLWDMIGDPQNSGNSEKYRAMGMIAITRILECGNGAGPNNLAGYQIPGYEALNGMRVAIKIGVEKGDNGHEDKNRVAEYLTPNPASQSGHKGYAALMAGQHAPATAAKPQVAASGFGGQPLTTAPAATGGFGNAAPAQTRPAASGFGQAQEAQSVNSAQTAAGFSMGSPAQNATSPSNNPAATPGWLAQTQAPA